MTTDSGNKSTLEQALTTHLDRELQALSQLNNILDREHEALKAQDAAALADTATQKQATLNQLQTSAHKRLQLFTPFTANPEQQSLDALITSVLGETQLLTGVAQQLAALTTECQNKNQRNGMLITRQENVVQKTLNILRPPAGVTTYSETGGTSAEAHTRHLGKV